MSSYSLSVYCPSCGRTEDGVVSTEGDSINCSTCGQKIAAWEDSEDRYEWVDRE